MIILFIIISILILIEFSLYKYVKFKKKLFPWLLFDSDTYPKFQKELINKFFKLSFDKHLGWNRKSNTKGEDVIQKGKAIFHINRHGERSTPGYNEKNGKIAVYGDSFAFCRLVNDDETWPYFLSKSLGEKVSNFGVGNYGFDQCLLKLKNREYPDTCKIIVFAIVPETIVRVRSAWKHFFEYGNILAFKPIYEIRKGKLKLLKNPIQSKDDFNDKNIFKIIDVLKKNDYFFKNKFIKDFLKFPLIYYLFKNKGRSIKILFELFLGDIKYRKNEKESFRKAFLKNMQYNQKFQNKLYKDEYSLLLLTKMIQEFILFCKKNNKKPVLTIIPQPLDIIDQKKTIVIIKSFSLSSILSY